MLLSFQTLANCSGMVRLGNELSYTLSDLVLVDIGDQRVVDIANDLHLFVLKGGLDQSVRQRQEAFTAAPPLHCLPTAHRRERSVRAWRRLHGRFGRAPSRSTRRPALHW